MQPCPSDRSSSTRITNALSVAREPNLSALELELILSVLFAERFDTPRRKEAIGQRCHLATVPDSCVQLQYGSALLRVSRNGERWGRLQRPLTKLRKIRSRCEGLPDH